MGITNIYQSKTHCTCLHIMCERMKDLRLEEVEWMSGHHVGGSRQTWVVQASPRPLRISSANSKLAGRAPASDQASFGDTEVQVQYLSLRKICVSNIFQLILKIIMSDISRWFPKVDGIPASRGGVHHAVRYWMTVSIRKASPLEAWGSEEAPGRAQWAMGMNIRTHWRLHCVAVNSYLCHSVSTSIPIYLQSQLTSFSFYMFLSVNIKHYALSV